MEKIPQGTKKDYAILFLVGERMIRLCLLYIRSQSDMQRTVRNLNSPLRAAASFPQQPTYI